MTRLHYNAATTASDIQAALALLVEDAPELAPASDGDDVTLHATLDAANGVAAYQWDGRVLTLRGETIPQLLRALMLWRGFAAEGSIPPAVEERTPFTSIGLMVDASRNAVPTVETVKLILRRMALLGMNQLMLYTEDTYEVPEQPLIGYLRGRYTQAELRELDDYAAVLGIEIIPCIQALAHLHQMLRWPEFAPVRDTHDILLVDEPRTYALLEQMLSAATAPYRSKRIHLGMDEAHDIGLGRYRQLHGTRPRFEILSAHLKKLDDICSRLGLRPMIWSDMYFRLAAANGEYYADDARIKPEVVGDIPADLQLVYWDYYHTDPEFYREWTRRHEVANRDILFAAGLWTWSNFWSIVSWTRLTSEAGLCGARDTGVREVFTTAWCDDGGETDILSLLPGLTHFAANAYRQEGVADEDKLRRDFRAACNGDWDAWVLNGQIDHTPGLPTLREIWGGKTPTDVPPHLTDTTEINFGAANPSKTFLWQDPLVGVADGNLRPEWGLTAHYRQLAQTLEARSQEQIKQNHHALPLALARTLAEKAELGQLIQRAYQSGDREGLRQLCDERLPRALAACEAQHETHRRLWYSLYKPFGWEVLDGRYGWLEARLRSAGLRLRQYLDGQIERIEELESPRLPVMPWTPGKIGHSGNYRHLISPSTIT